ncbi:ANTAR domain-containing protein [Spongisporangium articulatum]|uniref:ANTAR domain-containing protein n=1 Tax=Spongisporangium articulatum TaxID=3362603 RepID=A0ABW8AUI8_9ACTN
MTSEQASVAELILQVQELERELATLRHGLDTRTLIGQATGLLAGSLHLSTGRAWQVLRLTSSYSNVKMRDVARVLVHAHDGVAEPDDEALAVLVVPALERASQLAEGVSGR